MTTYNYEIFIKNKHGKLEHNGGYAARTIEGVKQQMKSQLGIKLGDNRMHLPMKALNST